MKVKATTTVGALAPLLVCLCLASPSAAAEGHAEAVLAEAEALLGPEAAPPAEPSEDITFVLAELAAVAPQLEGDDRRTARALLARPDDFEDDRYGDGFNSPEADESPHCSANFCVHWVDAPGDPDSPNPTDTGGVVGVPDFVEETLASADESYSTENTTLGWTEPLSDGSRGGVGPGLTDAYLIDTNGAYFGYASPDEGQGQAVSKFGYLVLDEDNEEFADDELTELEALQATMAHEYAHVLQFTYDSQVARGDLWMLESVATWMEEQVYPTINDYLRYTPSYAASTTVPLTKNDGGLRIYGAALWNHFLSEAQGPGVVRDAWEDIDVVTPAHLSAGAYDSALGGDGASPFDALGEEYAAFAASSAEWRAASSPYPDPAGLTDAARSGRIVPNQRAQRFPLDHLAHGLLKVPASQAAEGLTLKLRCPDGIHCGAALVTRDGTATAGTVTISDGSAPDGGLVSVSIPVGDYDRVTAVAVNADASLNNSGRYTADDSRFKAKLTTD